MFKIKIRNFIIPAVGIGLILTILSFLILSHPPHTTHPAHSSQLPAPTKPQKTSSQNPLVENRPAQRSHPYGGTLVWGTFNAPSFINPILTTHSVSSSLMELIFDSLVKIDGQGNIIPGLAKSWEISEDGLEYIFNLQKGVKFHDGIEFTAEDVKFTYDLISDPKNKSQWRSATELIERWEIIDKYSLKAVLKKTFPPLLSKLVREIIPKHIYQGEDIKTNAFNYHPIGTGSFRFNHWDRATDTIELTANPKYFEGRPYLDRIVIKTYPDNEKLWVALMRGEIDLARFINYEDYKILKKDPAFKAYAINSTMYFAMVFNPHDPVYHDVEVRRAVAHAIDRARLMRVSSINGIESTGPFNPDSPAFNPGVKPLEYDFRKARVMLMHRGWKDPALDANGGEYKIRRKGGKNLELRLLVDAQRDVYARMAKVIFLNLAIVGIDTKIILYNDEKELTPEFLEKYKPQAWLRFFQGLGLNPYATTRSWYSSSTQFGRLWPYKNEKVDSLFECARTTTDIKKRIALYQQIHKVIYEDQPACFLFSPVTFHAVTAKFQNTGGVFNAYMPTYTLKDWYI